MPRFLIIKREVWTQGVYVDAATPADAAIAVERGDPSRSIEVAEGVFEYSHDLARDTWECEPAEAGEYIDRKVRSLKPDQDHDENDEPRPIPVGTEGRIVRFNHFDRDNLPHYDIQWSNGATTTYSAQELTTDVVFLDKP